MNHKQHTCAPLPWSVPIIKQGVKWKSVRPYLPNIVDFFNSWFQLRIMLRGSRQMYRYLIFLPNKNFCGKKINNLPIIFGTLRMFLCTCVLFCKLYSGGIFFTLSVLENFGNFLYLWNTTLLFSISSFSSDFFCILGAIFLYFPHEDIFKIYLFFSPCFR